jgi:hypothetical protein
MANGLDNGTTVNAFRHVVATCNIDQIPSSVEDLIDKQAWRFFVWNMQSYENTSFIGFIRNPIWKGGCGWQPEMVKALIKKSGNKTALFKWRRVVFSWCGPPPFSYVLRPFPATGKAVNPDNRHVFIFTPSHADIGASLGVQISEIVCRIAVLLEVSN